MFDRDALLDPPEPRPGTPQARHTHGLLAGGCRALESLFPGIELDLVEAGEVDKVLAEVRSLLKPRSALREPELASRVTSMMAPA